MKSETIHMKLDYLMKLAPDIQAAIPVDAMIGVTDTEKFLLYLPGKELNLGDITGMPIPEGDSLYLALQTKKPEMVNVPRGVYGIPFRAKGTPIKDDTGKIIGAFGIGISLDSQEKLSTMAHQFASTSEEISASTEQLSSSAQDLANFMESINSSQQEMNEQVKRTEQILGIINSIASSSRILGLNAGIEAARSGEHGRGFSVVAQEITKLADSSANSVEEIRDLLVSLKEKVEYIAETVKKTTEVSQQQSEATEEISTAINHLANVAEDIENLASKV